MERDTVGRIAPYGIILVILVVAIGMTQGIGIALVSCVGVIGGAFLAYRFIGWLADKFW